MGLVTARAPAPAAAEWRSGVPATTRTPGGRPSSAATAPRTSPTTLPKGTRGGSLAGGTPAIRTSSGS